MTSYLSLTQLKSIKNSADIGRKLKDEYDLKFQNINRNNKKWQFCKDFDYRINYPLYITNSDSHKNQEIIISTYTNKDINEEHWNNRSITLKNDGINKDELVNDLDKYLFGEFDSRETNHFSYEIQYIKDLKDFDFILLPNTNADDSTMTMLVRLYYDFGSSFLKRRIFYNLVHIIKSSKETVNDGEITKSYILQVPVEESVFESHCEAKNKFGKDYVIGKYCSIETVDVSKSEMRWSMSTSNSPGGYIPSFLARLSMNKIISEDVPHLLNFIGNHKV